MITPQRLTYCSTGRFLQASKCMLSPARYSSFLLSGYYIFTAAREPRCMVQVGLVASVPASNAQPRTVTQQCQCCFCRIICSDWPSRRLAVRSTVAAVAAQKGRRAPTSRACKNASCVCTLMRFVSAASSTRTPCCVCNDPSRGYPARTHHNASLWSPVQSCMQAPAGSKHAAERLADRILMAATCSATLCSVGGLAGVWLQQTWLHRAVQRI